MSDNDEDYKSTLNAWKGSTPKQQQRRLQVKEAGFWSDCAAQPFVADGAGLISKKAAQQATAVRFPEYDPRADPHLTLFFDRQEERAIQVLTLRGSRTNGASSASNSNNNNNGRTRTSSGSQGNRLKRGGKTQASLAKVGKAKSVRMPKPPPGSTSAPAPTVRQQKQLNNSRPTSASIGKNNSVSRNNVDANNNNNQKLQLDFVSQLCPELKALEDFKKHQENRDEVRQKESHRRAVHNEYMSHYSPYHPQHGGNASSNSCFDGDNHHQTQQSNGNNSGAGGSSCRSICMPVDSDHVLAIKRLFVRSAVKQNGNPCRNEVCAIKNASEDFYIIFTREVDLPDILYMGIAQSNRYRQVAGLAHMTPLPSADVIFNWLVILGCTETVDWPSFLLLCTIDLGADYERVADLKYAYQQFTEKTPVDSGMAYEKILLYLKSVAGSKQQQQQSGKQAGAGGLARAASFHANAFHDELASARASSPAGVGGIVAAQQSQNSQTNNNGVMSGSTSNGAGVGGKNNKSHFYQPGDFYGARHTCCFAEVLFSLMPYRIQFHLIKANARGFSVSKNYRGRVPHSSQHEENVDNAGSTTSSRPTSAKSNNTNTQKSNRSQTPREGKVNFEKDDGSTTGVKKRKASPTFSSGGGEESEAEHPASTAIRFHKFKNAKSRFLEEQAAETRYERKVWL